MYVCITRMCAFVLGCVKLILYMYVSMYVCVYVCMTQTQNVSVCARMCDAGPVYVRMCMYVLCRPLHHKKE
jgi:hypothetical protein